MRIIVMTAVLVAGCGLDDVDTGEVQQAQGGLCPKFGCGGDNSPWITGMYFHDLNRFGTPNAEGFALVGFVDANDQPYALQVSHGRMSGTSSNGGPISGQQLLGARMRVSYLGTVYEIRIDEVTTVPYWAKLPPTNPPTNPPQLEAYKLSYYEWRNPNRAQPLCHNSKPESPDNLTMANGLAYYTLVFEGDRVEDKTKTVTNDDTGKWFNLGCAGGALAKMYLTGHARVAGSDGFPTTPEERQTILKMFTADYCGKGTPYTVAGQPLTWADDHQSMVMLQDATTLEMRWDSNGAVCVGMPRAAILNTPASKQFPLITSAADIVKECKDNYNVDVPKCADLNDLDLHGVHIVSANRN